MSMAVVVPVAIAQKQREQVWVSDLSSNLLIRIHLCDQSITDSALIFGSRPPRASIDACW